MTDNDIQTYADGIATIFGGCFGTILKFTLQLIFDIVLIVVVVKVMKP